MSQKSFSLATAVVAATSLAAATGAFAEGHFDAANNHCYGAAMAGQNDCKAGAHSCKGQSTAPCADDEWALADNEEACKDMQAKCKASMGDK